MSEHIYTIIINTAFEASAAENAPPCCPLCAVRDKLAANELERILGAAMMEPSVRIETNRSGFCRPHYDELLSAGNRLGLALILESHLAEVERRLRGGKATDRAADMQLSCYLCERLDKSFPQVLNNAVHMWKSDPDFRRKLSAQKMLCLPHYAQLAEAAARSLDKRLRGDFADALRAIVDKYMTELREDVSLFIKKFDYRFDDLPWGTSKDSPERAARFLSGSRFKSQV